MTPIMTQELVGSLLRGGTNKASVELTPRQREILQLLAEGHSMKQVAAVLNVSPRTVAFHSCRMMGHIKVKSTAELIQFTP